MAEDESIAQAFQELCQRCEAAGIPFDDLEADEDDEDDERVVLMEFPAGKGTRVVGVDESDVTAFLRIPFESYSFLGRYDAIMSTADGAIEAYVESAEQGPIKRHRLVEQDGDGNFPDPLISIKGDGLELSLAHPSDAGRLLVYPVGSYSLHIKGLRLEHHADAVEALEKLANSLFFDLDSRRNVPLVLRRRRFFRRRPSAVTRSNAPLPNGAPKSEFDREPMELYWYGRSAGRMPLLQFLAYYQILEFYFDKYSQAERRRRIQLIVRDPGFEPHDDRDIGRILQAVGNSGRRAGFVDERSQLKATIGACADPERLRAIAFGKRNKEFFETKSSGLTDKVIRSSMQDGDLLEAVSNRIYDIRCKIVHTKEQGGGEDVSLLLPFSPEAEQLGPDIELLKAIVRSTLVNASRPLRLLSGRPSSR
ncbi:MAG: hypothetical protein ACRDLL_03725 [Solirubrobacterales bacterium]